MTQCSLLNDFGVPGPCECQESWTSSISQNSNGEHKPRDDSGGLAATKNDRQSSENLQLQQQQHPAKHPQAGLPIRVTAPKTTSSSAVVVSSRKSNTSSRKSLVDAGWVRNGKEGEVGMAGIRLLQVTKLDLSRAPFHASPEVSRKFLRSIRILRLHAFAATAIQRCGASWKRHGNGNVNEKKRYARQDRSLLSFGQTGENN